MYVKIVSKDERHEEVIECCRYRFIRGDDGIFFHADDEPRKHEVSGCKIYVINNEGKTIDRIR